ncbi:SGNH/GDSL hydrolase family protein [Bradyrhizobium sp. URHC0002]
MPKDPKKLGIFTGRGRLVALAVAVGLVLGVGPTSAQFFNFGGYQQRPQPQRGGGWFGNEQRGGGWFGNDPFAPYQQQYAPSPRHGRQAPAVREDFSKAPPPEKRNTVPERHILVLGDSMADWLAYGLEDVYADQPEMGVIRKHKISSGLIRYQPKGNPADWAAAAKGILATEKADAIVVMLGLDDRVAIREPAADKSDTKPGEKNDAKAKTDGKPSSEKPAAKLDGASKAVDPELPPDDSADNSDARQAMESEKSAGSPSGLHEFRDKRWVELYREKIDEMIRVLKAKGVPVLWVGLPAVRGPKATADTAFLDTLYRDAAGKAGITYVDVWDGFVDEAGRFLQQGPDFEGQIRRLRSSDGVYFTKAGALKLAHYAEREINRLLAARSAPIVLPTEPATPDASARPDQPAPRPLAGPIVPLVASSVGTDQLLGAPGARQVAMDAQAARLLIKGEALSAPAGRADDFAWPRREIGRGGTKGETPVASASLDANARAPAASPKLKKHRR